MTNHISLSRLWRLLRWQMPGTVMLTILLGVWVVLFTTFHLMDVGMTDLNEELLREGARKATASYWTIGANMLCIMACSMFNLLFDKRTAHGYFMLPSTMQEKFVASLLLFTLGNMILLIVGFVVADVLCSCLYYVLYPAVFVSGLPDFLHHLMLHDYYVDGHFELLMLSDDLCPLVWWHSVCVLCAAVIRRNAILFAVVPLLLGFPFLWLRGKYATELAGGLYDSWTLPVCILFSVLAVVHYVAAYKLFPRRTIVGHKYLAIL